MAEYIAKDGAKFEYKGEMKMSELWQMQKAVKGDKNINAEASSNEIVKILVTKITTPDGKEHTENMEKIRIFNDLNTKDGLALVQKLGKIISGDGTDPKETETVL